MLFSLSCQEGREAGDLWGQWRKKDSDRQYISFSGSVVMFRHTEFGGVYGNFQHTGDSLFIQCYSNGGRASDTTMVEDAFGLKPFKDIRVKIETLNGDILVLNKDNQFWSFYKY